MAEFISLYSGSSGNSSVVRCGAQYLIVDMGKGVRTTTAALKSLGLAVSDCAGILVTHEHSDHVKGLSTFLKKNPLPVYGAAATLDFLDANGIVPPSYELNTLEGREEDVGAFGVQSFPTSHDVPCVGYRIHTPDGKTMTIATDLGVLTPAVHEALSGCDLVALESNYDLHMLRSGPYPYYLRARIESVRGHLSNDECAAKLLELIDIQLAAARGQLEAAEAQITAGRKEYEKQLKNFGNTVSNSVMSQMSTEVGAAVETVRAQAQALLESVNDLIAVVKEPEIQQALIEVRDGLQKVMDKFNETGMRDIDSLIDIVAELRTITANLTTALQKLQDRVHTETGSEGSTA